MSGSKRRRDGDQTSAKGKQDNIWLNISQYNTSKTTPLKFSYKMEPQNGPLCTDAASRFLSIARFYIPGDTIPIYFHEDDKFFITLTYPGVPDRTVSVDYVGGGGALYAGRNPVFSFQRFADMINNAFDLAVSGPFPVAPIPAAAPKIAFVPSSATFVIGVTVDWNEDTNPGAAIYMNAPLFNMFGNFDAVFEESFESPTYARIVVKDNFINRYPAGSGPAPPFTVATEGYRIDQEFSSLYNMFDIVRFEIVGSGFNSAGETVPNPVGKDQNQQSANTVLADFIPSYQVGEVVGPRGYNYYAADGGLGRLVDMFNDKISEINIAVNLITRQGDTLDYYIPPEETISIKIGFIHPEALH